MRGGRPVVLAGSGLARERWARGTRPGRIREDSRAPLCSEHAVAAPRPSFQPSLLPLRRGHRPLVRPRVAGAAVARARSDRYRGRGAASAGYRAVHHPAIGSRMGLIAVRPVHAAAQHLERVLGDPFSPDAPVSFRGLVRHDEREEPPWEAFETLRAWGVHAQLVPQAFGGCLKSFEELLALVRVVSRRDLVLTTGLGSTMLAAIPVWAWGDDDQRHQVAQMLLGAGAFGSFAVSERDAGSDFLATKARAEYAEGGYRLTGEKWLIGNASRCSFVVAMVQTRPALSLLFIRPDQLPAGALRRLPKVRTLGLRGHDMGGLAFNDCPLPTSALLGRAGRGMEMAFTTLQYSRTMIGGMALGAADTALRLALGWGRDRRLYGKPIRDIPAGRSLLLGCFLDILIAE